MSHQNQKQTRRAQQRQVGQDDPRNGQTGASDSSARLLQDGQWQDEQREIPAAQQSAAAPAHQSRPGEDIESGRTQTEDAFDVDNRGQR